MKKIWFASGAAVGVTMLSLSLASVPKAGRVTDDTAIYQNLSEIRVARDPAPNFDSDIQHLARLESHYHEDLPPLSGDARVRRPMQRISSQKYRYSGVKRQTQADNSR